MHSYFNFWQTFQTWLCLWVFIPPNRKFFYHDPKCTRKTVPYVLIFVLLSILIVHSSISNTDHDGLLHGKSKLSQVRTRDVAPDWLQLPCKTRFAAVPKQASLMRHTSWLAHEIIMLSVLEGQFSSVGARWSAGASSLLEVIVLWVRLYIVFTDLLGVRTF